MPGQIYASRFGAQRPVNAAQKHSCCWAFRSCPDRKKRMRVLLCSYSAFCPSWSLYHLSIANFVYGRARPWKRAAMNAQSYVASFRWSQFALPSYGVLVSTGELGCDMLRLPMKMNFTRTTTASAHDDKAVFFLEVGQRETCKVVWTIVRSSCWAVFHVLQCRLISIRLLGWRHPWLMLGMWILSLTPYIILILMASLHQWTRILTSYGISAASQLCSDGKKC